MQQENTLAPILEAIPHRDPFLFVEEIVEYEKDRIVCKKTFTGKEFFFEGHYPGFPLVPGVLLCEATMQTGAILLAKMFAESDHSEGKSLPVVAKMGEVRFKQMIRPGDAVLMEVKFKEKMGNVYFLHGKITQEKKTVLQFEFACVMSDKVE